MKSKKKKKAFEQPLPEEFYFCSYFHNSELGIFVKEMGKRFYICSCYTWIVCMASNAFQILKHNKNEHALINLMNVLEKHWVS